jgi:Tfp pilus assembly protein PilF
VIAALALLLAAAPAPASAGPADPRSPQARYQACIKQADTDTAGATQTATQWAASGGGALAAHCLGIARSGAEDWKGAADAFSAAAEVASKTNDRNAADYWVSAGNAALAAGDAPRARAALTNALSQPSLAAQMKGEAFLDRARADVAANDLPAARADMNDALTLVPADPMAWLLSATLARRMGEKSRAASDIREAMLRAPNEADILYEAGNISATNGDMDDARVQWSRAVTADPSSDAARSAKANLDSSRDSAPPAPKPAPAANR